MANLDRRLVRVGIQIDEKTIEYFDGLAITASGSKYATGLMNETNVTIANMTKPQRDYVMTITSPYNHQAKDKKLVLDVGRESTGYRRMFVGGLVRAEISQPPDIVVSMQARTSSFQNGNVVSVSGGSSTSLRSITQGIANTMGLALNFQATDKQIANYYYTGGVTGQLDQLNAMGAYRIFVDDLTLVAKDYDKPIEGGTELLLTPKTGLVGMPQLDYQGCTVRFMQDAIPTLGGKFTVQTDEYPAANGTYGIYKLDFEIASRDTPFYWTAKGSQPGQGL